MAFSSFKSIKGCRCQCQGLLLSRARVIVNGIVPASDDCTITNLGIRVRCEGNGIILVVNGRQGRESLVFAVLLTPAGSNGEVAKCYRAPVSIRAVDLKANVYHATDVCVDAERPGAGAVGGTVAMQALDGPLGNWSGGSEVECFQL